MPKGPLRLALEDFFFTNFKPSGGPGWWERVKTRWVKYFAAFGVWFRQPKKPSFIEFSMGITAGILYSLFGDENLVFRIGGEFQELERKDWSAQVATWMGEIFSKPLPSEVTETLGAFITEPVLALFEKYAGKDDVDPKEFARAFHGFMIGLNVTGATASTVIEALTAGQIKGAGKLLDQMYWSLGLGFLGWQTLAPLLSAGLQPGLERYYNKLYRPMRFSAGDLRDLYALGELTIDQIRDEARFVGWRDVDIDKWITLAFRTLPQGDIFDAFHKGFIDEATATGRLRALGYDPKDIPLLFKLNPKDETKEARDFSVANARNAFSEGLITEAELRKILKDLRYSEQEIDIVVSLEKLSKDTKERLLSAGDIKAAWGENILTDAEARHWLQVAGFASDQLDILIDTWKKQIIPDYRKLNSGTIEGAYIEGILTKAAARAKLVDIGFTTQDADLSLSLVEARNPEAFGRVRPTPPKVLTPGILSELVVVGLITPNQMKERLVKAGYSSGDAGLLSEAARIQATPAVRLLPQRSVEDAFFSGVLSRANAFIRLKALGFNDGTANVVLDTVQAQLDAIAEAREEAQRKRLSAGVLEDLVIAGILTPAQMKARLLENGYSEVDATLLTTRAQQLAETPQRVLSQSTVERAYLVGVLDRAGALNKLIGLDFTPEDAEKIIKTVENENPAVFHPELVQSTRQPSIGALVVALQMGIITENEYQSKAAEIGYSPEDALLYIQIATRMERKSTKTLSVSQLINAYGGGLMPFPIALSRITKQGYSDADATLLLRLQKDLIQNTDVWNSLLSGALDPFDAIAQLVNANYADKDILDAFTNLGSSTLSQMGIDIIQLSEALKSTPGGA